MDLSRFWNHLQHPQRDSPRVSRVPKIFQKLWSAGRAATERYQETISAVGFLVLSIGLGYWAHTNTSSRAVDLWERTHPPSPKMVEFALGSLGMHLLKDERKSSRASRNLPVRTDEESAFWISPDLNWVAHFTNISESSTPQIYCQEYKGQDCKGQPSNWQPLGYGWKGLEKTLQAIQLKPKEIHPIKRPIPPVDPRALIY